MRSDVRSKSTETLSSIAHDQIPKRPPSNSRLFVAYSKRRAAKSTASPASPEALGNKLQRLVFVAPDIVRHVERLVDRILAALSIER